MVDHEEIRQLISAALDGELTSSEREFVEEHIKTCPACLKYAHDLKKLSSALKTWGDESLSPDLEQKITQRLTSKDSKEGNMEKRKFISMGVGSGLLTLVVLLALFAQMYVQRGVQGRLKSASMEDIAYLSAAQGEVKNPIGSLPPNDGNGVSKQSPNTFQGGLASVAGNKQDEYLKARGYKTPASSKDKLARLEKKGEYETLNALSLEKAKGRDLAQAPSQLSEQSPGRLLESELVVMDEKLTRVRSGQRADLSRVIVEEGRDSDRSQPYYEGSRYPEERFPIYPPQPPVVFNSEQYDEIYENPFLDAREAPLSTFSIDVDKASYANIRRFINSNQLPSKDVVRIEEMINYFQYDYPQPGLFDGPFSITTEAARCPWNPRHQLVMIGLQAKKIQSERLPPSNLVFLIDVSGSMAAQNKLPLLKSVFRSFVEKLRPEDRVSMVVYAGQAGLVLESTPGSYKERILSAIENLQAGGSTAGGEGVMLAYRIAGENFIPSGNNRVILATDGDFNVGVSSDEELARLIEQKRDEGVFLTVLGVGTGNYKDSKMEKLADKGNGNYAYLDNVVEGEKVLINEMSATLLTVAKDVKIQVEFNPAQVKAYKLIGYENRLLAKEDFNDDRKDAGEIGAGHSVTAFYEIVPADSTDTPYGYRPAVDPLKYQADENNGRELKINRSYDLMTIKLRYKEPKEDESKLITKVISRRDVRAEPRSENFKFAVAVAEFGMLLRDSEYQENSSFDRVIKSAQEATGKDPGGYRSEFLRLVKMAEFLKTGR